MLQSNPAQASRGESPASTNVDYEFDLGSGDFMFQMEGSKMVILHGCLHYGRPQMEMGKCQCAIVATGGPSPAMWGIRYRV